MKLAGADGLTIGVAVTVPPLSIVPKVISTLDEGVVITSPPEGTLTVLLGTDLGPGCTACAYCRVVFGLKL